MADVNLSIAAQDKTAAAFASVEKRLSTVSAKTAESSNKLAGVANFIGQNSSMFSGLGKAADFAGVSITALSGAMSVLGGPAGIALGLAAALAAVVFSMREVEDSTGKYNLQLMELKGNVEGARLQKLNDSLDETNKKITELREKWRGGATGLFVSVDQFKADQTALEKLKQQAVEYDRQIKETQSYLDRGVTDRNKEKQNRDEARRAREQATAKFTAVQEGLYNEEQAIMASYAKRWADIQTAENMGIGTQAERDAARVALTEQTQAKITEIQEKEAEKRQQLSDKENKARLSGYSSMFGNLASLMGSKSKQLFEIGKQAAKAQVLIDTYAGAQAIFRSMAEFGPVVAYAAAAAAVVAGMMRFQAIESTSFGGGSTGVSVGGGTVTTSTDFNGGATPTAPTVTTAETQTATPRNVLINLGDDDTPVSKAWVRSLIEAINEEAGDNVTVAIA